MKLEIKREKEGRQQCEGETRKGERTSGEIEEQEPWGEIEREFERAESMVIVNKREKLRRDKRGIG